MRLHPSGRAILAAAAWAMIGTIPALAAPMNAGALVLVNSTAPNYPDFLARLEPVSGFGIDFVVEIRDVAGYERAPSGVAVEEAIRRGVEETRREFDSVVPGVLFTHESDHIRHRTSQIRAALWDPDARRGKIEFNGSADVATKYYRAGPGWSADTAPEVCGATM